MTKAGPRGRVFPGELPEMPNLKAAIAILALIALSMLVKSIAKYADGTSTNR
jgi:hypothetical protein